MSTEIHNKNNNFQIIFLIIWKKMFWLLSSTEIFYWVEIVSIYKCDGPFEGLYVNSFCM